MRGLCSRGAALCLLLRRPRQRLRCSTSRLRLCSASPASPPSLGFSSPGACRVLSFLLRIFREPLFTLSTCTHRLDGLSMFPARSYRQQLAERRQREEEVVRIILALRCCVVPTPGHDATPCCLTRVCVCAACAAGKRREVMEAGRGQGRNVRVAGELQGRRGRRGGGAH